MSRVWAIIPGFPGYEASSDGSIRNAATRHELATQTNANGHPYLAVSLVNVLGKRVRRTVHRLVAATFCVRRADSTCVMHLNGNPADNRADNLAWGTHRQNSAQMVAQGNGRKRGVTFKRLTQIERDMITLMHAGGLSQLRISKLVGRHQVTVGRFINRHVVARNQEAA